MLVVQNASFLNRRTLVKLFFALLFTAVSLPALAQNDPFFGQKTTPTGPALFGKDGASPKAVRQGTASASYFHAAIAAIAKASPDTLRKAIAHNPGGGFKVNFPDGSEEYVLVDDAAYPKAHHLDNSEGDWVSVLMRGYAQHALRAGILDALQNSTTIPAATKSEAVTLFGRSGPLLVAYDRAVRSTAGEGAPIIEGVLKIDKTKLKSALTAQFKALDISASEYKTLLGILDDDTFFNAFSFLVQRDGEVFGVEKNAVETGIPQRVLQAFMGNGYLFTTTDKDGTTKYLGLQKSGQAMTATTRAALPDGLTDAVWFTSAHTYSVMSFDDAAQTVTLRDPKGTLPAPDGVFTIPVDSFFKAFSVCASTSNE